VTQPVIAVIGGGAWGTTLAGLLAGKGVSVRLWVRETEVVESILSRRENTSFLPGIHLAETLQPTVDLAAATAGADLLVMAVPSRWMRSVARELVTALPGACPPILTVTKGLEIDSGKRMSEVIVEEVAAPAICALSGPNLAPEVARGDPAATVIASRDADLAARAQALFMTCTFRPYTGTDIIGLEICGAVKNVIAIAAGICDGLGYGDNAKAALLTRAVAEIGRLAQHLVHRSAVITASGWPSDADRRTKARWAIPVRSQKECPPPKRWCVSRGGSAWKCPSANRCMPSSSTTLPSRTRSWP
jgi:glycerol-3-phosphate dehydrogenase (NAD(P)+)